MLAFEFCVLLRVFVFASLSLPAADEEEKTVVQKFPSQKVIRLSPELSYSLELDPVFLHIKSSILQYHRLFSQNDKSCWKQIASLFFFI